MTDQDVLMHCHRDLDLPICCPTGGVLVYRWSTEKLYAVSGGVGARTVSAWRELSALAAGPLLATLTRTGAVTGFGAEEDAYLQSLATLTAPAPRTRRRRGRTPAGGAFVLYRVASAIVAPIVAVPGDVLRVWPTSRTHTLSVCRAVPALDVLRSVAVRASSLASLVAGWEEDGAITLLADPARATGAS